MINQSFYSSIPTKLDLNGPYMSFTSIPSGISGNPGDTVSLTGIATASFLGVGATTVNDGVVLYRWYEVGVGALSDGNRLSGTSTNTLTISNLQSPGDSNRRFYLEAKYQSTAYKNRLDGKNGNHISPANSDPAAAAVTRPLPTASISASSGSIGYNGSVTISWSTTNANTLTSNFGDTRLSGSRTFNNQTSSRSFSITATNETGSRSASTFVSVGSPIPPSVSLSVSPSSIANGGSTTVTWSSTNASSVVSSNFGATDVNGTITLTNQTQSRTLSITVRSVDGVQRTASATLTVAAAPDPDPPPTVNFSASPSSIENGGSTTLTWSTSNATSLSSNFGVTDLNGTTTLTGLVETKEFEVIASGSGGTTRATATVTVAAPLPVIVITSQPSAVSSTFNKCTGSGGSANFSVAASVNNPTGATLQYQWYLNDSPLSNSANVSGAQTPNLLLKVLENQSGNNNVYVRISYAGATTVQSNNVPYSVTVIEPRPIITQTAGDPLDQTVFVGETATFNIRASASDGRSLNYQWAQIGRGPFVDGTNNSSFPFGTISGATTPTLRYTPSSTSAGGIIYAIITDPSSNCTASNSPFESELASFSVREVPRKLIRFAQRNAATTNLSYGEVDLNTFTFGSTIDYEFYAPFEDIQVDIKMEGAAGLNNGSFRGGQGGQSIVRLTLRRNTEYVIRTPQSDRAACFLYEQGRLIAVVGGGGGAGANGNGGNGGGCNLAGQSGFGSGGGRGGSRSAALPGYFPGGGKYPPADTTSIFGGLVSSCTIGNSWWEQRFSPCSVYGNSAIGANGNPISGSAPISRGFKEGLAHRNNGGFAQVSGDGAGASGCEGGSAATPGSRAGGGGGGGFASGVSVIATRLGGRTSTNGQFIIALPGQLSL
jgi:hypothetical protein